MVPCRAGPAAFACGQGAGSRGILGRLIIHYPSYLVFVAAANRLDLFLHVYLAINAAYAGRTILAVLRKLGRSSA
jgi:hypothetical protein